MLISLVQYVSLQQSKGIRRGFKRCLGFFTYVLCESTKESRRHDRWIENVWTGLSRGTETTVSTPVTSQVVRPILHLRRGVFLPSVGKDGGLDPDQRVTLGLSYTWSLQTTRRHLVWESLEHQHFKVRKRNSNRGGGVNVLHVFYYPGLTSSPFWI